MTKLIDRGREQLRSLLRFPLPIAVCVALSLVLNLEIAKAFTLTDELHDKIIFAAVGAFFAGLVGTLWAKDLSLLEGTITSFVAAAAAVLLLVSRGVVFSQDWIIIGAILLVVTVAAHLHRSATVESFWLFNLKLAIAAAMGIVALVVVCGGLSLLLLSIHFLFEIPIADAIYERIWTTGWTVVAPLFALAMIPKETSEQFVPAANPNLPEKATFYVLNFALAPLVLLYALMLHIYAAKIAITLNMPKGEVGWMVLTFGLAGTACYMIMYPWRNAGVRSVRWLLRSWFWLMIFPGVLLLLAVSQRIAGYGVTPDRYCLCLFGVWLVAMIIYFSVGKGAIDLRAIPLSLAIMLLMSSFGPWGSIGLSARSQVAQLHRAMTQRNLLFDGKLRIGKEKFVDVIRSDKRIRSIITELYNLDALDRIRPIFRGVSDDPFQRGLGRKELAMALGMPEYPWMEPAVPAQPPGRELANSSPPKAIASSDSIALNIGTDRFERLVGPLWINHAGEVRTGNPDAAPYMDNEIDGLRLSFLYPILTAGRGNCARTFNLAVVTKGAGLLPKSPMLVPAREGRSAGILILVNPAKAASEDHTEKFEVWLLLDDHPSLTSAASKH